MRFKKSHSSRACLLHENGYMPIGSCAEENKGWEGNDFYKPYFEFLPFFTGIFFFVGLIPI